MKRHGFGYKITNWLRKQKKLLDDENYDHHHDDDFEKKCERETKLELQTFGLEH